MKRHPDLVLALAAVCSMAIGLPTWAADDTPEDAGTEASAPAEAGTGKRDLSHLEQIVVRARKREESLQDVPTSVSALTASALDEQSAVRLEDISNQVPSLRISSLNNSDTQVTMRGRGNGDPIITIENSVGLYIDGVFVGRGYGANFDLMDIDQIEVLRGPQGTLFGKNTPSGAIVVRTRKPDGGLWLDQKLVYGSWNEFTTRTRVNLPIFGENGLVSKDGGLGLFAIKGTFYSRDRDTIYDDHNPGTLDSNLPNARTIYILDDGRRKADGYNGLDHMSWDIAGRWQPNESLDVNYRYEHTRNDDEPILTVMNHANGEIVNDFGMPNTTTLMGLMNCSLTGNSVFTALVTNGAACTQQPAINARFGQYIDDKPGDTQGNGPTFSDTDVDAHSLNIEWNIGEASWAGDLELTSVTGYRSVAWRNSLFDLDATPYVLFHGVTNTTYRQFQQELQLAGTGALDGNFSYVVGAFYGREHGIDSTRIGGNDSRTLAGSITQWCLDADGGGLPAAGPFSPNAPASTCQAFGLTPDLDGNGISDQTVFDIDTSNDIDFTNWNLGFFGQGTYDIDLGRLIGADGQRLSLTAGVRRNKEKRNTSVQNYTLTQTFNLPFFAAGEITTHSWTPMASIAYYPTDDFMGYFTYSKGFRSGGFNGRGVTPATFAPFGDETVNSFEWGIKSQWLENRLQLNVAYYYQKYDDLQVSVFTPASGSLTLVQNAGSASMSGVEVELLYRLNEYLSVDANYAYVNAKYKDYLSLNPATGMVQDISNLSYFARTPDNSVNMGVTATLPDFGAGDWTLRLDNYWQASETYLANYGGKRIQSPDHYLLDARLQVANVPYLSGDGYTTTLAVYGKNLTDETYVTNGIDFGGLGWSWLQYGLERRFGVELQVTLGHRE